MIQLIKSAQVPTASIALHVFGNFGLNGESA